MFKLGITKTAVTPSDGAKLGSGKVTLQEIKETSPGVVTMHDTDEVVDVYNMHGIEIPTNTNVTLAMIDGHWDIVKFDQSCSVNIPGTNSLYFLTEIPRDRKELDIKLGDWIDIPPNVHAWPEGTKAPEQVLCRSKEDPKHYKLFKYRREIEGSDWEDTGMNFGGTFSAGSWEAFARSLASLKTLQTVTGVEAP